MSNNEAKINAFLPNLVWEKGNYSSKQLFELLKLKYPEDKIVYEDLFGTHELITISIEGLFKNSNRKLKFRIGYDELLHDTFLILDEIKSGNLNIIEKYNVLIKAEYIEVGVNLEKESETDFLNKLPEVNFLYNGGQIGIKIKKSTIDYFLLFEHKSNGYSLFFMNSFEDESSIIQFIDNIKTTLKYLFYKHHNCKLNFYDYNYDLDINKMVFLRQNKKEIENASNLYELKDYDEILIQYASTISTITYLPFKYLTYYHILEHNFDICLREDIIKFIDTEMNTPTFVENLIKKISKYKDEKKKLELVLKKFLTVQDFKENFIDLGKEVPIAKSSNGILLDSFLIESKNFFQQLSNRIYTLRNAIVHSKSNSSYGLALNYSESDYFFMYNEILLVKWIAEKIIETNK